MAAKKRYIVQVPASVRNVAGISVEDVAAGLPKAQDKGARKGGVRVLELDGAELDALVKSYPGLLIEEDQELQLLGSMPGLGFQVDAATGCALGFLVVDAESDKPIAGATIFVSGANATYRADTGGDGKASVVVHETDIGHVIVSPSSQYWSRVSAPPAIDEVAKIALTRLTPNGAAAWSRNWLGVDADFPFRGEGVKVALIDSGIAEHPDLAVAGGFNALDGEDVEDFRRDEKGHGTHCAGILAGRNADSGVFGIAPDAEVYSIKVFPGGYVSDLIEGLQWAIDNGMDVVNLSLGMRQPSMQLAMKLIEAAQNGIVLVAATGNDGSTLSYPAADDGVIAVGAFGSTEAFPADSAHVLRVGPLHNPETGLFVANFSNQGPQTAFIAPGVAIVSSVPGGYAAWDGTSMACPFVAGLAAVLLSADPGLATRDLQRVVAVRNALAATAVDFDLPSDVQGAGVPRADAVLGAALLQRHAAGLLAIAQQESLRQIEPLIADLEHKQREIQSLLAQLD